MRIRLSRNFPEAFDKKSSRETSPNFTMKMRLTRFKLKDSFLLEHKWKHDNERRRLSQIFFIIYIFLFFHSLHLGWFTERIHSISLSLSFLFCHIHKEKPLKKSIKDTTRVWQLLAFRDFRIYLRVILSGSISFYKPINWLPSKIELNTFPLQLFSLKYELELANDCSKVAKRKAIEIIFCPRKKK